MKCDFLTQVGAGRHMRYSETSRANVIRHDGVIVCFWGDSTQKYPVCQQKKSLVCQGKLIL